MMLVIFYTYFICFVLFINVNKMNSMLTRCFHFLSYLCLREYVNCVIILFLNYLGYGNNNFMLHFWCTFLLVNSLFGVNESVIYFS